MKIYILPVDKKYQPLTSPSKYPNHNRKFYGIEQDFFKYLQQNDPLIVDNYQEADWHYLPIFWTHWHLNHDYAKRGRKSLMKYVNKTIIDDSKTFTVCQYGDGPLVNLGKSTLFLSSRKEQKGIDVPLICDPHELPLIKPRKKYLASFVGRLSTHRTREKMADMLKSEKNIFIFDGIKGTRFFVKKMIQSYIALCPRGYGGSSFRFYEAMQLGTVPYLIGNYDTRPFKKFLDWDPVSLYSKSTDDLLDILNKLSQERLKIMGEKAKSFWQNHLNYQKWCPYVLKELKVLKDNE